MKRFLMANLVSVCVRLCVLAIAHEASACSVQVSMSSSISANNKIVDTRLTPSPSVWINQKQQQQQSNRFDDDEEQKRTS